MMGNFPTIELQLDGLLRSALFIKTRNHVRACPLLKPPCIHFTFAKIKQYTYKSHCFKIHFHMYTSVQKQIPKLYITCVQMFGNAKHGPIICIVSNHGFLVINSLLSGWKNA